MKGVYYRQDRSSSRLCWRARLRLKRTEINKLFETEEEARKWYLRTKEELTRKEKEQAEVEQERKIEEARAKKEAERERRHSEKRLNQLTPEERRAKARQYYVENREKILAQIQAKKDADPHWNEKQKQRYYETSNRKKRTKLTDEERQEKKRVYEENKRRERGIKPVVKLTEEERKKHKTEQRKKYIQQLRETPEGREKLRQAERQKHERRTKEYLRAREHKRRAREKNAVPSWAKHVVRFEANLRTSIKAITKITKLVYNIDHIVPLSASLKTPFGIVKVACGLHCEDNLQILEQELNLAKNCFFWDDMWEYDDQSTKEVYELYERTNTDFYLEDATRYA